MDMQKIVMQGPYHLFAKALLSDLSEMEQHMLGICPHSGQLNEGLSRVIGAGGKRLRPMLAWTCWHMAGEQMPIIPLMTMLELMHTTSLIHDDYVDGAGIRRGVPTISAADGALAAIRSGDYLLARAMEFLELYRGTGINEALSAVSQEMCLGELDQHAALFSTKASGEDAYFRRIKRKTALLMAECCRCGAIAGGAESPASEALWNYGLHLGMAFQLRDDLLDWDTQVESGKPPLRDLESGVITLPLIYALERGDEKLRHATEKVNKSPEDTNFILESVKGCKALNRTYEALKTECGSAVKALSSLPEFAEKESLLLLAKTLMEVNPSG